MIRRRHPDRPTTRAIVLAALAACHFVAACGVPMTRARAVEKETDRLYPCMNRPCGCMSYDECWAGDCCCFTLQEKVQWARANGLTPPVSGGEACLACEPEPTACEACRAAMKPTPKAESCPLCEKPAPAIEKPVVKWVIGVFAQKCRGMSFDGPGLLPPAVPVPPQVMWRDADTGVSLALFTPAAPPIRSDAPPTPPPRPV